MSRLPIINRIFLFILFLLIISCKDNTQNPDEIIVSVSIPPLADFAKQIVGNRASVNTLIPPGSNMHSFEPNPEIMKSIYHSAVYFGLGDNLKFEKILLGKIGEENIGKFVDCSKNIEIIDNDPHIWLSPKNAKLITEKMLDELIELIPQHKFFFINNQNRFIKKLDSIDAQINNMLKVKKDRTLFVYHPAWKYFSDYYKLEEIGIENKGKTPKARDLKDIIIKAKSKGANCIFFDPHYDDSAVISIANSLNLATDSLDPLPENYLKNLIDISDKLEKYLR